VVALRRLSVEKSERLKLITKKANKLLYVEMLKQRELKAGNQKDARRMEVLVGKDPRQVSPQERAQKVKERERQDKIRLIFE
jgi:hypothetical protein